MKTNKIIMTASLVLIINVAYAVGNLLLGVSESSWWFMTLGIYYLILSSARLVSIIMDKRARAGVISMSVGVMLMVTAIPLLGIVILSTVRERGNQFHEIIMITMALYAFSKITLAIINLIKVRKGSLEVEKALRNISLADAFVSIASLQRSMLVSFGDMAVNDIKLFNVLTGTGVSIIIFLLGLNLVMEIRGKGKKSEIQF